MLGETGDLSQRVITMFDERLGKVEAAQERLASAMERQASAMEKLAVLWSKHEEHKEALGRAFERIEDVEDGAIERHKDHEDRIRNVEADMPVLRLTRGWVIGFTVTGCGLLLMAVAALVLTR